MTARLLLVAFALAGCTWTTGPGPEPPPPDGPGTCQTSADNLAELGGCGEDLYGWEARCEDASRADAEVGLALPRGCWTAAGSCAAFQACR